MIPVIEEETEEVAQQHARQIRERFIAAQERQEAFFAALDDLYLLGVTNLSIEDLLGDVNDVEFVIREARRVRLERRNNEAEYARLFGGHAW